MIGTAIKQSSFPLYLWGATGRGKTCTAALVYATWPGKAIWLSCSKVLRQVANTYRDPEAEIDWYTPEGKNESMSAWQFWQFIDKAGLVVIDDIGIREATDVQREILTDILDRRAGKPLILTGNINPRTLHEVFDGRIQSRCCAGTIHEVTGSDQRVPKEIES